jgi:hypothetical protein
MSVTAKTESPDPETPNATKLEGLKAANGLSSQMITVAAGLLTFTVTFVKKFSPKHDDLSPPLSLKISWALLVATMVFGFVTSMAIVGTMSKGGDAYGRSIKWPAVVMLLSFLGGIIALIVAGGAIVGFSFKDLMNHWPC